MWSDDMEINPSEAFIYMSFRASSLQAAIKIRDIWHVIYIWYLKYKDYKSTHVIESVV